MKIKTIELVRRFQAGIVALSECPITDFKTNMVIGKNIQKIIPFIQAYEKAERALVKQYTVKNDIGNAKTDARGNFEFPSAGEKEKFESELEALQEQELDIEIKPVRTSVLQNAKGITGLMIGRCIEMIEDDAKILE